MRATLVRAVLGFVFLGALAVAAQANPSPVADAGGDQHFYLTDGSSSATVTLDGSASYAPGTTIASYVWKDSTMPLATGQTAGVSLNVGTHTINLTVTATGGATASAAATVTVTSVSQTVCKAATFDPSIVVPWAYDWTHETFAGNYGDMGYAFTPTKCLTVTAIGQWAIAGALSVTHNVCIFDTTTGNAVLAQGVGAADAVASDRYAWHTLSTPATLVANRTYLLIAPVVGVNGTSENTTNLWVPTVNSAAYRGTLTINGTIGYNVGSAAHSGDGQGYPYNFLSTADGGDAGWFVGNFKFHEGVPPNQTPTANAGPAQPISDLAGAGQVTVRLDGTGSSDSDGQIVSYIWKDFTGSGFLPLGTGRRPLVTLGLGTHQIVLTVTDNTGATSQSMVVVTVTSPFTPPTANAGADSMVTDTARTGSVAVTVDGSASTAGSGAITSYVWKENGLQVATGATAQVTLDTTAQSKHDLQLIVTNSHGLSSSDVRRVWVMPQGRYFVSAATGLDTNAGTSSAPFKTIGKAVSVAGAGHVIIVRAGTYREQVAVGSAGTPGQPITIMGYPYERVILTGADALTGWKPCTPAIAHNNTNYAHLYYTDIAWLPTSVSQDTVDLRCAQTPGAGRWIATGGGNFALSDSANLTQASGYWVGALCVQETSGLTHSGTVTAFDGASHTLTVDQQWASNPAEVPGPGSTGYYLARLVELISGAGQWAAADLGNGSYRVFVWADGGGNPSSHVMDAGRRSMIFFLGGGLYDGGAYWTFDNLEFRDADAAILCNNASSGHRTYQNCLFDGPGINDGPAGSYDMVRNCTVVGGGLSIGPDYSVVEGCDIGACGWHGLNMSGPGGANTNHLQTLRHSCVHDEIGSGHPDGIQILGNIQQFVSDSNFLFCNGVAFQGSVGGAAVTVTNTTIVGGWAYGMSTDGGAGILEHNTELFAGWTTPSNNSLYCRDNFSMGTWAINAAITYTSDYNCFWGGLPPSVPGQDTHSYVISSPLLMNVPEFVTNVYNSDTGVNQYLCTDTLVYLANPGANGYAVGDHIEINWDGVVRTVTGVGSNTLTFTPGDDAFRVRAWMIANWKTNTNFALDLRPCWNNPMVGAAHDGTNMGSTIDINAYLAGDFNGDGRRDCPDLPAAPVNPEPALTATATVDFDWVYQATPVAAGTRPGHLSVLTIGVTDTYAGTPTYTCTMTQSGAGLVTLTDTANILVKNVTGSLRTDGLTGTGLCTLHVVVTNGLGGNASADVALMVRPLGDVDGSGAADTADRDLLNLRLNGLDTGGAADAALDLDGDGQVTGADRVLLNRILNNLPLP